MTAKTESAIKTIGFWVNKNGLVAFTFQYSVRRFYSHQTDFESVQSQLYMNTTAMGLVL